MLLFFDGCAMIIIVSLVQGNNEVWIILIFVNYGQEKFRNNRIVAFSNDTDIIILPLSTDFVD